MPDEGLRFEAWSLPHVGTFAKKFDFTKFVESYTLNDRFNDLCDGVLSIPDDAALATGVLLKNRLLYIDEANHVNDVGSTIRIFRGSTSILNYITTRLEDSWSDSDPTSKLAVEGLEWLLDRALVPNFDHPADPTVDPDWIYGADTVLKNAGLEESGQSTEVQLVWLTGATGGTFTITYSAQTTSAIAWNADWFAVGNALEALSNIQDVTVSGAGTGTSPWTIEFLDPAGDVAAVTLNIGSLTGPAPLQHIETTLPGGQSDTAGWTTSFNPSTGEPHGTYDNFQVTTAQAHTGTHSLLINASAPANPADFPGAQQLINVTAGRTYRAEVWIRPTFSSTFKLVIRTMDETWIAESTGSGTPLTANVWTKLTVDPFVIPAHIDQIIFRVGLIDSTDQGDWYLDDAVLAPGFPAATLGKMMSDVFTAAQALGVLAWLTPTWSTTLDSDGNAWDASRQWNVNHGQTFLQLIEYKRRWNYESRIRWDAGDNRFEWDMWNPTSGGQVRANIAITGKSGVMGSAPIVQRPPNATYVKAEGELGRWGEFASTTLDDVWGRLEKFHQDRQGVASTELDVLAERIITKTGENTAARAVTVSDPSLLPWQAYEPGDTVTLNLAPKDTKRALRVAAIVVSKGPNDAAPKYDVHFGSPVYSNDTAIASGLRTLIREFRRPTYTNPAAKPIPEIPPPLPSGGSAPTLVIAASNSPDSTRARADYICTGAGDNAMWTTALGQLADFQDGRLLVTEGDYYFSGTVTLYNGVRIEGMGEHSTRIHMSAAANATTFYVEHSAGVGSMEPISISHLTINGEKAAQTSGTPHGFYVEPNGGTTIALDHVTIKDCRGSGAYFDRCADIVFLTDCSFTGNTVNGLYLFVEGDFHVVNCLVSGNTGAGIVADGAELKLVGNTVKSNGGGGLSSGGIFEHLGYKLLVACHFGGNTGTGISLDGVNAVIADCYIATNTTHGISVAGNQPVVIVGNVLSANTQRGITISAGAGNEGGVFATNVVKDNGQHGIYVGGAHWQIHSNRVEENGQTTNNTYDGIHIEAAGDNCEILLNKIRQAAAGNAQRYGINLAAGATANWVAGNRAFGTYGTADYNDAGTGTINVWAGTFGDNQP